MDYIATSQQAICPAIKETTKSHGYQKTTKTGRPQSFLLVKLSYVVTRRKAKIRHLKILFSTVNLNDI